MFQKVFLFYPELVGAALKKREIHLFLIWCILRQERLYTPKDKKPQNGLWLKQEVLEKIQEIFDLKPSTAYQWLEDGVNKYWTKPNGKIFGQHKMALFSMKKILENTLEPTGNRVPPFLVPFYKLYDVKKIVVEEKVITPQMQITALMLGLYISRYNDATRPISIEAVASELDYSVRQIQRMLKNCHELERRSNGVISNPIENWRDAKEKLEEAKLIRPGIIIKKHNFNYYLIKRIADSYIIQEFDRAPVSYRSKYLRKWDKNHVSEISTKKYYKDSLDIPVGEKGVVPTSEISANGCTFWKRVER